MLDNLSAAALAGSLALSGGGSGLISVPTATLMPLNTFEYQHSDGFFSAEPDTPLGRRLAADDRAVSHHIQFAVVPRLEFGARLTATYKEADGERDINDLSGHLKLQLLDSKHFRLAIGARDFSGDSAKLAPAEFAVADVTYGPLQLVAGFGRADTEGVALDGPFGGLRYSPFSWLDLIVDHDGVTTQSGVNLHYTRQRFSLYLKAYSTDSDNQDAAFAVGARFPLGDDSKLVPRRRAPILAGGKDARSAVTRDSLHLAEGTDALARRHGQNLRAEAEEACHQPRHQSGNNIPLLELSCQDGRYGVSWATRRPDPDAVAPHLRLRLDPVQRYAVGSDVGRLDYSIALRPSLQALLYDGLTAHMAYDIPLANTDDYEDGGAFERDVHEAGVVEVAAQYTMHPWPGLFFQAGGGNTLVARELIQYVRAEAAVQLWRGRLGLHYSYTDFAPEFTGAAESQGLGKLFAWIKPARYAAEITAGRFLYGDSGGRLDLYKYLGRVRLGLYLKQDDTFKAVGMTLSAPLNFGGGYGNRWVSVSGTPHYRAFFETQVDHPTGSNLIQPNFLRQFHPQRNLLDDVLDQWRASPLYVESR